MDKDVRAFHGPHFSRDSKINCSRRDPTFPPAVPLAPECAGWESGRQFPTEDMQGKYWKSVRSATQKSVSKALDRQAKVCMIKDDDLDGMNECHLFTDKTSRYDVVIVHNDIDVLLATCTIGVDIAMRNFLEKNNHPAASKVLDLAKNIQKGTSLFEWIVKHTQETNNPAKLGHKSPGDTVDFGLQDHQIANATMLPMRINDEIFPPGLTHIRAKTYLMHRSKCIERLSIQEKQFFLDAITRMTINSKGNTGKNIMLPCLRTTSTPHYSDEATLSAAKFEGICRASASDLSMCFFNSLPGICALKFVQDSLKWTETKMLDSEQDCPFAGATDYLYAKGSMSLQPTKGWHDDANEPACLTCWQNFGEVQESNLELCISIRGCKVRISAGVGKFVHFMGWLPHCTRLIANHNNDVRSSGPFRLHHTAYTKFRTEYAAYVLNEYRSRNLDLPIYKLNNCHIQ